MVYSFIVVLFLFCFEEISSHQHMKNLFIKKDEWKLLYGQAIRTGHF